MTATANLAARVAEAVGTQQVMSAPEELVAYAVDGLAPAVIVRPKSAAETVEVVRFAIAERLKLIPLGSRSKCDIGMPPTRYDIAVDMTALRGVAHYDAGDLTLSVEAGTPLREVEGFLKNHRQFLPLAVPCFESTTAGGTIASGIDSVLRKRYGTARDFLIGAEFVDGKGQLCKSGGRVVKNVTGYDLHKLLIGSLGTLGVMTRLNFRTFPLPAVSAGHVANFGKAAAALEYCKLLEKAGIPLANLEVISPETIQIIRAILQQTQSPVATILEDAAWCVYSSYEGTEAVVQRISQELEKCARGAGSRRLEVLETAADESLGGMLREAFEWLRWASPATLLYKLTVCGGATEVIAASAQEIQSAQLRSATLARSCGVLYVAIFSDHEEEMVEIAQAIDPVAVTLARTHGGHATLIHAPLNAKLKIAETRGAAPDRGLQEQVKKAFDPGEIFVPGRTVGGI